MKNVIKKAFVSTIPVFSGYIVLGIGFGLLMHSKGLEIQWVFPMSAFIYAGSMQYVGAELMSTGASLITTAITTVLVNARHLFYGISMIDKYKDSGKMKPYLIFALTDETYSLVCHGYDGDKQDEHKYYFFVSLFDQLYWISGSIIGVLLGQIIPFNTAGIDFSLTALFVTVVTEQWLTTKNHISAIIGFASSILCLVIFGPANFLIPTMILITLSLTVARKFIKEDADE